MPLHQRAIADTPAIAIMTVLDGKKAMPGDDDFSASAGERMPAR